jgi:polyisoprenyl-phosphate glycosyltransferase
MGKTDPGNIVILIPVYNDWKALSLLLASMDQILLENNINASVIAIDDGSSVSIQEGFDRSPDYKAVTRIDVFHLGNNFGHQKAIAIAISHIEATMDCHILTIMDSDGEDNPADIPELIKKIAEENFKKIIFARRTKRSEGLIFSIFYFIYKQFFQIATGSKISFGNFCAIPGNLLPRIVLISEIWCHFSSGIIKSKLPHTYIPTARNRRLCGQSRMNFVSLVKHGLSAISVHADVLGVRTLIVSTTIMLVSTITSIWVVSVRLFTDIAIPGWASTLALLLILVFMQALSISMFFIFIVLNGSMYQKIIPKRDYRDYLQKVNRIYPETEEIADHE